MRLPQPLGWLFILFAVAAAPAPSSRRVIDLLDYMLQSDDTKDEWTLNGTDVRADRDPDGTATRTFILNKWSNPDCYEVYKVTNDEIQLRYEVFRPGGKDNTAQSWIRRFEEDEGQGPAPGAIWMKRHIAVDEGFTSHFRQDRFVFDPAARAYVIDKSGSAAQMQTYLTAGIAANAWPRGNNTNFRLNPCLRITSEWQTEGLMFEMYDYARGKGLVAWRWLERLKTLRPLEGDRTGKIFHCENGYVFVEPLSAGSIPIVYRYDPDKKQKGDRLEVIGWTSHWKPDLGEQWYVVYRNTSNEEPLVRKRERIVHDFTLPEWESKPGAMLKDLPYLNTHPPR